MKTIFKIVLAVTFAIFADASYAMKFSNLRVNIFPISSESAALEMSTSGSSNFKITVADDKGRVVFSDQNAKPTDKYSVQFDYSKLNDGAYKLSVVSGDLTTERKFRKIQGNIKVGKEKMTLKPFFGYKNGVLKCSYLNFPKEFLNFYLLKKDQLLYSKDLGKDFNISEAVNLAKLNPGSYKAVLSAGGQSYSYMFEK